MKNQENEISSARGVNGGVSAKIVGRQQEFETQSSIVCYHKINTHEEAYKCRIQILERRIQEIDGKYQLQVNQERVNLNRLKQKCQALITEQAREAILWKSSVEEVESTVQYFLSALQDQHHLQLIRIRQKYQAILDQLQMKLQALLKERKDFVKQVEAKVTQLAEIRASQRRWVAQNLHSNQRIKEIQQAIKKCNTDLKIAIQVLRTRAHRDSEQAKLYAEQLKRRLLSYLREEKIKRQIRKEEILQHFQKILTRENFQ